MDRFNYFKFTPLDLLKQDTIAVIGKKDVNLNFESKCRIGSINSI